MVMDSRVGKLFKIPEFKQLIQKLEILTEIQLQQARAQGVPVTIPSNGGSVIPAALPSYKEDIAELIPFSVIPYLKEIDTEYQDEQERTISYYGVIEEVLMAFPSGCHQLVDVRLLYKYKEGGVLPVVPSIEDTYITLDDVTHMFRPNFPVSPGSRLMVEWYNYDTLNKHTVPVVVTITRGG